MAGHLEITEDWIKERIKLDHDNLDDVKSLALPGTYHEKITKLGFSLQNFTRLQHLDLSKNNLVTLKGLEHLSLLEQLNLYYNKIQDLKEIFRLRKNQNLRDIDLRLNPVTGNEPDYRLFIAHMLPLLRRLDDRPVRDSERKAAFLHFSATELPDMFDGEDGNMSEAPFLMGTEQSRQPRVNYVKSLVQKPTVMHDNDTINDVIDFVNQGMNRNTMEQNEQFLPKPPMQMHTQADLVKIVRKETEAEDRRREWERDIGSPLKAADNSTDTLKFEDEDSAYTQYKSVANYTPHPGNTDPPPTVNQPAVAPPKMSQASSLMSDSSLEDFRGLPEGKKLSFGESTTSQEVSRRKNLTQIRFVESFLNLVDRYWNGSKSLHYHQKFQSLVQKPLEHYEAELSSAREVQIKVLQDKVATQHHEIQSLHQQLHSTTKQTKNAESKEGELSNARAELDSVKSRLNLTSSDNKILRSKVAQLETDLQLAKQTSADNSKDRVRVAEQENRELTEQVVTLKSKMEQYEKLSKLTEMLQDSHRSLVTTNEHLLGELEDARRRHQSEIEQLKWSYDKLRSTKRMTNGHGIHNGEL